MSADGMTVDEINALISDLRAVKLAKLPKVIK